MNRASAAAAQRVAQGRTAGEVELHERMVVEVPPDARELVHRCDSVRDERDRVADARPQEDRR